MPLAYAPYIALACVVAYVYFHRRRRDPTDFAASDTRFSPDISLARFAGYRDVDPLDYDDAIAAVREFSRLYQTTHLAGVDVTKALRLMHAARRTFRRNMHRVRFWLPNSASDDARILAGIDETDAAMAVALSDVTDRFPHLRLLYGAGKTPDPILRSVDDTW